MTLLEDVKVAVERTTGWRGPSAEQLARLLQSRRIATFRFRDDGFIPNNPRFPVAVYRSAVNSPAPSTRRQSGKRCLNPTAGAVPGATGSTIISTITHAFTKCWASLAGAQSCVWGATKAGSSS
jgi:hypothetical protein